MEERRAFERIPSDLPVRLFIGDMFYSAKITNLSENGMLISSRMTPAVNSVFVVVVRFHDLTSNILVKVRRAVRSSDSHGHRADHGIGVELLNPPPEYVEFVGRCRSSGNFNIN